MRLMVVYYDGDYNRIVDIHSDNLKINAKDLGPMVDGTVADIVAVVEVPDGMDYDKLFYGQSLSMHPHPCAMMITKASTNELNDEVG